jgi:spermidine synthase
MVNTMAPEGRRAGIIYPLFFLSGFAGLVYEVTWTRMFALVFGATTFAISTVLAAFMAGLALGSFYFGRLIDRRGDPLRLYAYLEISIGVYAVTLPFLISLLNNVYVLIHRQFPASFLTTNAIKFALSFVVLIIPTTLMGGTLPVLSRFVVISQESLGFRVGGLYSVNTVGGAVGCFAAGFVLIAFAGIRSTIYVMAGINIAIGATALVLRARHYRDRQPDSEEEFPARQIDTTAQRELRPPVESVESRRPHPSLRSTTGLMIVAFGISGFAALAYEVLWTRVLSMILGTTVYAFSVMLTAFLCGLALGSFISARVVDKRRRLVPIFAVVQIAIGCFGILSVFIFGRTPLLLLKMLDRLGGSWRDLTFVQFAIAFLVMLIPTSLMGATFPLVSRICARQIKLLGRSIGSIYSVNTIGAILGSLAAGFLLIPAMGLRNSIMFTASINILTGLIALIGSKWVGGPRLLVGRSIAAALAVIVLLLTLAIAPSWDNRILASGVYFGPWQYFNRAGQIDLDSRASQSQMLYYAEGIDSTVAVFRRGPELTLSINGKPVASTTPTDISLLGMMGHLPMILHEGSESVLVIGLGAGVTAGMVAQHASVERIDCVELEQKVVDAAKYFVWENRDVLHSPKLNLIIDDGRNYLLTTTNKYDVITSDPIHPWVSGAGSLYAAEHFQLCKMRLNEGGIIAQWLPLYEMPERDFRTVIRTFQSVFPHTTLWLTDSDSILIGTQDELRIDYRSLVQKLRDRKIEEDMRMLYLDSPFDFLTCFAMGETDLSEYAADAKLNTDNHPILEFSAPKGLYSETVADNLESVSQNMKPIVPLLRNFGGEEEALEIKQRILTHFERKKTTLKEQILNLRTRSRR